MSFSPLNFPNLKITGTETGIDIEAEDLAFISIYTIRGDIIIQKEIPKGITHFPVKEGEYVVVTNSMTRKVKVG